MKTYKTHRGTQIHLLVGLRSNVFLVVSPGCNLLVDTGKKNIRKKLRSRLRKMKVDNRGLDYLLLTHTHFDHCRNAAWLKRKYGCRIVASALEASNTRSGYTELPEGTLKPFRWIISLGRMFGKRAYGYEPFEVDLKVEESLDLEGCGAEIRLIATPGHSPGSISIIIDREIALVGDILLGKFKDSVFPPFADNVEEMVESWGRLLETGCRIFLPGHGNAVSRELLEKEYGKYRRK